MFAYFLNEKTKGLWLSEVEKDLQEVGLSREEIEERNIIKKELGAHQRFQEKPKRFQEKQVTSALMNERRLTGDE